MEKTEKMKKTEFEESIEESLEEGKKKFDEMGRKINDFTSLLNKYNFDYKVQMWEDAEGFDIIVGDDDCCRISFYIEGRVAIEVNDDGKDGKDGKDNKDNKEVEDEAEEKEN